MLAYPKPDVVGTPFGTDQWKKHVAYLKKNGKGDRPAEWDDTPRWDMANVHLLFFDLFERVYLFADHAVQHNDLINYLGFAEVVLFNVSHDRGSQKLNQEIYKHHGLEETLYYPEMTEAAGVDYWSVNTTEHRLFDQNMEAAMLYVRFCRQNLIPTPSPSPVPEPTADLLAAYDKYPNLDAKQPFDPKALRSHLDEVILVFGEHMTDEIETLSKDKISLVGEKEYAAIDGRLKAKLQAYGPEWFLCIAFASVPMNVLDQLLPLPFVVRNVLVPIWWGPKYAAWWKYCPYPENLKLF